MLDCCCTAENARVEAEAKISRCTRGQRTAVRTTTIRCYDEMFGPVTIV